MKHEAHSKEKNTKQGSSKTTTDLDEIKKWAEAREGKPVIIKGTEKGKEGGGVLRIDFPGFRGGDTFEEVSWDEWYEIFKSRKLEFLYQDKTADGKESRFFKLINKE
jgi:hypothetical protein